MKKLLIILAFLPFIGVAQSTIYQDSLRKWEWREARRSWGWFDSLTTTQQITYIRQWYSLKIKVAREQWINHVTDSTSSSQSQLTARQAYINHLKSLGYECASPPSLNDWKKAYNHPEWFGANWLTLATQRYNSGATLNDLLNFCRQYNF